MPRFSEVFNLGKRQSELDFVDVPLHTDVWLAVDPVAIGQRVDFISQQSHETLLAFFQEIIDSIRSSSQHRARQLLMYLREPNETHLGMSKKRSKGAAPQAPEESVSNGCSCKREGTTPQGRGIFLSQRLKHVGHRSGRALSFHLLHWT